MAQPLVEAPWKSPCSAAYAGVKPENLSHDPSPAQSEHAQLRERLRARYAITGEYVGAPSVALILGLGRTTVHDQVKSNRFVIPHRLADRKPLFLLDDLVAWMLGREWPRGSSEGALPARNPRRVGEPVAVFKHADAHEAFLRMCERRGISPGAGSPLAK